MSNLQYLYVVLGLFTAQLVLFGLGLAYQLSASTNKASGWKGNILSGLGFVCMSGAAFLTQNFVSAEQAWYTWLSGCTFVLVASVLLWLGFAQRRLLKRTQKKD